MEKGDTDLNSIIYKSKLKEMEFVEFFKLFRDSVIAMTYMHANTLSHRDIKPDNIIKMKDGKYAMMDFGVSVNIEG